MFLCFIADRCRITTYSVYLPPLHVRTFDSHVVVYVLCRAFLVETAVPYSLDLIFLVDGLFLLHETSVPIYFLHLTFVQL